MHCFLWIWHFIQTLPTRRMETRLGVHPCPPVIRPIWRLPALQSGIICKIYTMNWKAFYVLLLPYFVSVFCTSTIDKNIVVTNVERKIDIASHIVKTYTSITIENKGSATLRSFLFVVDPSLKNKVSFIGAVVSTCDACNHFSRHKMIMLEECITAIDTYTSSRRHKPPVGVGVCRKS